NRELSPAEAGAIFLNTYLDPREGIIKKAFKKLTGQDLTKAVVQQLQTLAKAEIATQKEIQKYLENLQKAKNNFQLAYRDVYSPRGALENLKRNTNDPDVARLFNRALDRLEQASQELKELVLNNPLEALSQKVEENRNKED